MASVGDEPLLALPKEGKGCCLLCGRAIPQGGGSFLASTAVCGSCTISAAAQQLRSEKAKRKTARRSSGCTFDWGTCLDKLPYESVAPVDFFKHCPLASCWDTVVVKLKVEVPNWELSSTHCAEPRAYWTASVVRLAGYNAQVRYLGHESGSADFWINLCSPHVHPVGWCAANGRHLVPPPTIEGRQRDWAGYLIQQLAGSRTLPCTFYDLMLLKDGSDPAQRFSKGTLVEVIDKECVSRMRAARVADVVGGRLHLVYEPGGSTGGGATKNASRRAARRKKSAVLSDFWCHHLSPLVHHVGWSAEVGHAVHGLAATSAYVSASLAKLRGQAAYDAFDSTPEHFVTPIQPALAGSDQTESIVEGMKLEAVDPLNLSTICVATVKRVLKNGYLMINVDGSTEPDDGSQWFCYHVSSPTMFPVGFCEMFGIELTPPQGYDGSEFSWGDYLYKQRAKPVPPELLSTHQRVVTNPFKVGMKLEAVDLIDPRYVCAATVARVAGWLLRITFDGWTDEFDQWIDCESPDIYPAGWCEINGLAVSCGKWPPADAAPPQPPSSTDDDSGEDTLRRGSSSSGKKKQKQKTARTA